MGIRKKPETRTVSERDIDTVIGRGGSEADTHPGAARTRKQGRATQQQRMEKVLVRIPSDLLERIDLAVAARPLPTPRQHWILEALLEKVEHESNR